LNSPTVDRARQCGIEFAISNPYFELWLILHFQNCAKWSTHRRPRNRRWVAKGAVQRPISDRGS
jgi:hypothetical protein